MQISMMYRPDELLKGIYKMGFQKPSKIQEKALPLLLQNPCVPDLSPHRRRVLDNTDRVI